MNKNNLLFGIFVAGLLLIVQGQGWIDLTRIIPDTPVEPDKPVVVVPDTPVVPPVVVPDKPVVPDTPVPTPDPQPIVDDYPAMPTGLAEISKPIYDALILSKNDWAAIVFADTYRTWSTTKEDIVGKVKSTRNFVDFNNAIIKDMLASNQLKNDCAPGIGTAIQNLIVDQIGDKPRNFTSEDDELIKNVFKAISRQAYNAYVDLQAK